jgi:hypothetical protein
MRIFTLLLCLGLGACATAPPKPVPTTASGDVTLAGWCERVSAELCAAMSKQCFGGNSSVEAGCTDTATSSCVAGRNGSASSGHPLAELDTCVAKLRSLSCEGLGAGLSSGDLTGCQARVQ